MVKYQVKTGCILIGYFISYSSGIHASTS